MFSRHDCKCKHCNPVPMRAAGGFRTKADRFLLTFPAWHVCVGLCVQDLVSAVLAIEILRLKSCAARHAMLECEQALRWRYHACIYSGSVNKTLGMQQPEMWLRTRFFLVVLVSAISSRACEHSPLLRFLQLNRTVTIKVAPRRFYRLHRKYHPQSVT